MKIEYVLPKRDRERIAEYEKQIEEIKQSYIHTYEKQPFRCHELDRQTRNDRRIQVLQKCITNIYMMSVGKYIITAESEEDRERIRELLESQKSGGVENERNSKAIQRSVGRDENHLPI